MTSVKWKDYRNPCKDLKFFAYCMYQSYLRLILYRFQIYILFLVFKLYSFLFLFWIQ